MTLVFVMVVGLGVGINSIDSHHVSEHADGATGEDLVTGEVVISNEGLTGLLNLAGVGKLLSAEEAGEGVETVVLMVSLSDFDGVISQVVVDYERSVFGRAVETEHLSVVIQELLLRSNFATSELLLKVLEHEGITLGWDGNLRLLKGVTRASLGFGARLSTFHHELSGVIISIVDTENASIDGNVKPN